MSCRITGGWRTDTEAGGGVPGAPLSLREELVWGEGLICGCTLQWIPQSLTLATLLPRRADCGDGGSAEYSGG